MFYNLKDQFFLYMLLILVGVMMSSVYATPSNITLIADPAVLKTPIKDNYEELVDLTKQAAIINGPSPEIKNNTNYTFLGFTAYPAQTGNEIAKRL